MEDKKPDALDFLKDGEDNSNDSTSESTNTGGDVTMEHHDKPNADKAPESNQANGGFVAKVYDITYELGTTVLKGIGIGALAFGAGFGVSYLLSLTGWFSVFGPVGVTIAAITGGLAIIGGYALFKRYFREGHELRREHTTVLRAYKRARKADRKAKVTGVNDKDRIAAIRKDCDDAIKGKKAELKDVRKAAAKDRKDARQAARQARKQAKATA